MPEARFFEEDTIRTSDAVNYVPMMCDGRVGYRVDKLEGEETVVSTYIYFNPSDETDDGVPNVFVYEGVSNNPALDSTWHHYVIEFPISYVAIDNADHMHTCMKCGTHESVSCGMSKASCDLENERIQFGSSCPDCNAGDYPF